MREFAESLDKAYFESFEPVTENRITHDGVNMLDMFPIGSNGACCYHALHVGSGQKPFGYALMSDCQDFEDQAATFSEGLTGILEQHWEYVNEVWE